MDAPVEIVRYGKPLIFRTIGYKIYAPAVKRMHLSTARMKVISAPARTSKSLSASADVLPDCFPDFGIVDGKAYPLPLSGMDGTRHIWICAPHFRLAKEFSYLWTWLVDRRKRYGWAYDLERAVNAPDSGHMSIELSFGNDPDGQPVRTHIQVKSEANERSLQAEEVHRAILSESADLLERTWTKYLSTRVGRSLLPTTPKPQADWIRKLIEDSKADPLLGIEHFEFDGRCNPTYDWERYWVEHRKAESRQSSMARTVPVDAKQPPSEGNGQDCFGIGRECAASRDPHFAEQFMGRWTYAESRVLAFRWMDDGLRVSHILDLEPTWISHADKYVSVDYGFNDPACAVFFAVDADGTVVCFDEIYERGVEPDRFCRMIHERAQARGYSIKHYFSDPQKPEVMRYLQRLHLPVIRVDQKRQRDRQTTFMILQDYLSDDPVLERPKLFLMRVCQNGIREMRILHRREAHTGNEFSTEAIAGDDHFVDALRCALATLPQGSTLGERMQRERGFSIFDLAKRNHERGGRLVRRYDSGGYALRSSERVGASGVIR